MRLLSLTVLLCCATLLHAQNFIVNGTFNSAVPTNGTGGGWTSFNLQSTGWSNTGGNPGANFLLNSNGIAPDPTIQQVVTGLTIGQSYTVAGDYRLHVPLGNPTNSFGILLDGTAILQLGNPGIVWTPFVVDFIATNTSHTLAFAAESSGSDHSYFIDNIQLVVAVPEPATLVLIGLGVTISACVACRRLQSSKKKRRRFCRAA